ncbi:DLST [Symbiodinium natans]|uniref:DLST protein n=1 Tax=Symbiodinium natans TaxID=878477 RepID=A0A812RTC3_9DINO|nr:DLST [Symbiodinium natans]
MESGAFHDCFWVLPVLSSLSFAQRDHVLQGDGAAGSGLVRSGESSGSWYPLDHDFQVRGASGAAPIGMAIGSRLYQNLYHPGQVSVRRLPAWPLSGWVFRQRPAAYRACLSMAVRGHLLVPAAQASAAASVASAPSVVTVGEAHVVNLLVEPLLLLQQMTLLQVHFPAFCCQEVDMTAALRLRSKYKDMFQKLHGPQLGMLSLIVKAIPSKPAMQSMTKLLQAIAMASFIGVVQVPGVNAIIDDGTVDISIPIPSPRGIIACTLRDAHSMSIRDMEHEIAGLTDRAARDELCVEDLSQSTFGIVDAGIAGGMLGTGIINYPQSASMGTNAVKGRVTVVDGKVEARPIMPAWQFTSLTYDHRLVDGREAVTFLCNVRDKLQDACGAGVERGQFLKCACGRDGAGQHVQEQDRYTDVRLPCQLARKRQAVQNQNFAQMEGQASIKWYDPRRAYGFCYVSVEDEVDGATKVVEAFFGREEAQAARDRGLSLARGEGLLCDLLKVARGRFEATQLHSRSSGPDATSRGADHLQESIEIFTQELETEVMPALGSLEHFPSAADRFCELLDIVWNQHSAAGRARLEAFVQQKCFKAVQVSARQTLMCPDLAFDTIASDKMSAWLARLSSAPWCWSSHQRQTLREMSELAQLVCGSSSNGDECHVDKGLQRRAYDVLRERTSRFVVVLEGVRNSANQQMILRTCEALGIQEVWLVPPPSGAKYRATMVRSRHASRGAERFLTLRRFASVEEVAACCKAEARELWASYCPPRTKVSAPSAPALAVPLVRGSVPSPLPRLALVLGTEGDGISADMLRSADLAVFIPMYGFMQSLNVAVACGMLLQRLFDLCPEARGDIPPMFQEHLAARLQHLRPARGCEDDYENDGENDNDTDS